MPSTATPAQRLSCLVSQDWSSRCITLHQTCTFHPSSLAVLLCLNSFRSWFEKPARWRYQLARHVCCDPATRRAKAATCTETACDAAVGLSKKDASLAAKDMLAWLEDSKSRGFPPSFFQPGLYAGDRVSQDWDELEAFEDSEGSRKYEGSFPGVGDGHPPIDPSLAFPGRRQALPTRASVAAMHMTAAGVTCRLSSSRGQGVQAVGGGWLDYTKLSQAPAPSVNMRLLHHPLSAGLSGSLPICFWHVSFSNTAALYRTWLAKPKTRC